jgi:hypothetical protein
VCSNSISSLGIAPRREVRPQVNGLGHLHDGAASLLDPKRSCRRRSAKRKEMPISRLQAGAWRGWQLASKPRRDQREGARRSRRLGFQPGPDAYVADPVGETDERARPVATRKRQQLRAVPHYHHCGAVEVRAPRVRCGRIDPTPGRRPRPARRSCRLDATSLRWWLRCCRSCRCTACNGVDQEAGGTTAAGLYEQIKEDLGYLGMSRSGERFVSLADDAWAHSWTHLDLLARLLPRRPPPPGRGASLSGSATPLPVPQGRRRLRP